MPVHRVPIGADLEHAVDTIQATETIVSTVPAGDGAVLVFTEPRDPKPRRKAPGDKETRG